MRKSSLQKSDSIGKMPVKPAPVVKKPDSAPKRAPIAPKVEP